MAKQHCIYPDRESVLVAYLYDDIETSERVVFETHVATCEPCRTELAELRGVRSRLAEWAAPDSARRHTPAVSGLNARWWHEVPAWAQVAAALLVLGVSASIANLDVRYDRANGLSVRTGWSKSTPAAPTLALTPVADVKSTPWRTDLAALQKQLRDEIRAQSATVTAASAAAPPATSDAELQRRLSPIVGAPERTLKAEVATTLSELHKDVYAQEQYDHSRYFHPPDAL